MGDLYQTIDMFSDEIVKIKFLLLFLVRYLLCVAHGNRYLPRGSKEDVLSITIAVNVSIVT